MRHTRVARIKTWDEVKSVSVFHTGDSHTAPGWKMKGFDGENGFLALLPITRIVTLVFDPLFDNIWLWDGHAIPIEIIDFVRPEILQLRS